MHLNKLNRNIMHVLNLIATRMSMEKFFVENNSRLWLNYESKRIDIKSYMFLILLFSKITPFTQLSTCLISMHNSNSYCCHLLREINRY